MSQTKKPPSEIFLDTSILIAILKGEDLAKRIRDTVACFDRRVTCAYAKLEYGNNILHSVSYYQKKLEELGDLEQLRYFVANRLRGMLRSHSKLQTWFFNLLFRCFDDDRKEATERAKRTLRILWYLGMDPVCDIVDETVDNVRCIWVDQKDRSEWRKPEGCNRGTRRCGLPAFFTSKREIFFKLRQAIESLPTEEKTQELSQFAQIIEKAAHDPECLRDHRVCRSFGDAIIAIESVVCEGFFTQNIKESRVLCRVLEQYLLYLKQDPNEEVGILDFRGV